MMKFDLPQEDSPIIKVIGVGGGGSNAVNHMYKQGIKGVDFIVCNTDQQSLDASPVEKKLVLGENLTKGRGAGSIPEAGKNAAIESADKIKELIADNTEMVFITAGFGGGTGTGAAPVIAAITKEMGILTVGIVTVPFSFEGKKRKLQADEGLEELKKNVDTLLIISNDKLREIYGNLKVTEAFSHADDIITTAAKGIAEIITTTLQINTDINDVKTVMKDSGVAIMGAAKASGENRAKEAVEQALMSPLLNDNNITGARYVLVNIVCGEDEITMDELGEITDYIQDAAGMTAEIIKGYGVDPELGDSVSVTIIATGFESKKDLGIEMAAAVEPTRYVLGEESKQTVNENTAPITNPISEAPVVQTEPELLSQPIQEEVRETPTPTSFDAPIEREAVNNTPPQSFTTNQVTPTPNSTAPVEESVTYEFQLPQSNSTVDTNNSFEVTNINKPSVKESVNNVYNISEINNTEQQEQRSLDRISTISRLKDLSFKIKTQNGLSELENEPAYKRRNVDLTNEPHSSESQISRYSLSEGDGDNNQAQINSNNSFLHDNVD